MIKAKPKTKPASAVVVTVDQIKSFVERIENLETEHATVALDKRGVFDEAKKVGINTKMLRRFIADRKRDAKDSETDKEALDLYRAALCEPGETYRSVAARLGMSKSRLQRLVPKRENGTEHDATTGEITETAGPDTPPSGRGGTTDIEGGPGVSPASLSDAAPQACVDGDTALTPAGIVVPRSATPQTVSVASAPVTPVPDEGVGAGTSDEQEGEDKCLSGRVPRSDEHSTSCGLCPVSAPDGGEEGNGFPSAKGEAAHCPSARRHPSSDDALVSDTRTSRCEDGASPGPQDLIEMPPGTGETGIAKPAGQVSPTEGTSAPTPPLGAVGGDSDRVAAPDNAWDRVGPIPDPLLRARA